MQAKIKNPSVPPTLQAKMNTDLPMSFSLLPVVELPLYDSWDDQYPLAPAVPSFRTDDESDRVIVDWTVVRCPFCGGEHIHRDIRASVDYRLVSHFDTAKALAHSSTHLGARRAKCTVFEPAMNPLGGKMYFTASYFMVGIDSIPTTSELDDYFPMATNFIKWTTPDNVDHINEAVGRTESGMISNAQVDMCQNVLSTRTREHTANQPADEQDPTVQDIEEAIAIVRTTIVEAEKVLQMMSSSLIQAREDPIEGALLARIRSGRRDGKPATHPGQKGSRL